MNKVEILLRVVEIGIYFSNRYSGSKAIVCNFALL